ncbi:uncharacterized protein LOC131320616 isoform X2 [Rhododendron vialii]|uniref:uncharacterized protein LOC131320616 isoform X2 n=1 Tax=Rhododendron vialii TaxID=182163 RepID=UPI00265F7AB6|nr:uncharacterized protein LOC131320616 isoform X2 [Rhododendron vialii]
MHLVVCITLLCGSPSVNDGDRTDYGDSGAAEDAAAGLSRQRTQWEYKAALRRAVALDVPEAYSPSAYGTFDEINEEGYSSSSLRRELPFVSSKRRKESWDDLAGHLLTFMSPGRWY